MAKQVLKISSIHESGIESEGLGEQSDGDCDSYLFSFGIMRKEEEEMWIDSSTMAVILFAVWFIFGWAYMSEMDQLENMDDTDED